MADGDGLDRLKTALSDRYTIERELGAGGMATVYLAHDIRHERQVAVKVLRPDLAAALGPDRFLQEIRIAANLHHPHILPLYDSGESDGFLYYVMPYEEGHSLREKLAREGELPITEAVRILREVVDALAHAHEHGVVHRDIKPDNVMLSGRHALVTDFGVAKAVSEATGRQKLTTEGIALGTPAYMAPEQAAADPHIDHRADIYAVGAVAYELLTGRPPFTGTTPQEILAAHVTQAVEPVTKYRDSVSPALAELVMRCLKKKPADRWQTAEELLPQLEALATPSGGMTPTDMMPVTAAGRGWKVWAAVGAVVAIVAIVFGVLVSGGEPEGPPRLAVLPFDNLGAAEDEYFADGITEEITSRLARVSGLIVIARSSAIQYKDTEKNASQIAEELNVDYLLEGTVRWSRPSSGESRVRVSPQLIRGSDEAHVWAEPFEAELTEVFALQANIAEQVAAGLHVALQPEETAALETRPTDNMAAYDVYLRGMHYYERGQMGLNWEAQLLALEMFDSAATLDPDFVLAHAMRANAHVVLRWSGHDESVLPQMFGEPRMALARAALDEAERIDPEHVEVRMALARYYYTTGDTVRMEAHAAAAIRQQPNDPQMLLWLADLQVRRGELDSAEASMQKAGELDPRSSQTAAEISGRYRDAGSYEEALRYADRAVALAADEPFAYLRKAWLHVLMGDTVSAHRVLQLGSERVGMVNLLWAVARTSIYPRMLRIFDEYGQVMRGLSQDAFGSDTADYLIAKFHSHHASPDLARPYFDSLIVWTTATLQVIPDQGFVRALRVEAYAGTERAEEARQEVPVVLRTYDGRPGGVTTVSRMALAEAYVMLGEQGAAVEQLRILMSNRSWFSTAVLRLDPIWDPLRDHPGFRELLESGN